jgi:hypothetical protein
MVIDSMVLGVCFACEVYYSCFVSRLLIRSGILFLSPIYALANNSSFDSIIVLDKSTFSMMRYPLYLCYDS